MSTQLITFSSLPSGSQTSVLTKLLEDPGPEDRCLTHPFPIGR